jgi:hypothetical protein
MPKFDSKTFNAEAFGKYMQAVPNTKLQELRKSRAIVSNTILKDVFKNNTQTGTAYAVIPFYGLLAGEAQNYDGVSDLTPSTTTTFEQGVFTYGRMKGWTEADFSYDITGGADFMANVRQQIQEYWGNIDQDVLLSILKGIFSMKGTELKSANKNFVEKHTLDISKTIAEATDETTLVGVTTLNTAIQKACGDNKSKFSLVFMHSNVATNLENLQLLKYLTYTDVNGVQRDLGLATWNGRTVIIDDSMPTEEKKGTNNYTQYTTYILGEGAFGFEEVGAKVPFEMFRDPKHRGGEDTLISRIRNAISVAGISYLKKSQVTNSPTNAELEKAENWSLVNDGTDAINDKAVPIARIISRG